MTGYSQLIQNQKNLFESGTTKDLAFRKEQLSRLYSGIKKYEDEIYIALQKDLGKSVFESYLSEVGTSLSEISLQKKNLKKWAAVKKVRTGLMHIPGHSYIYTEPLGNCLIISPWNYPFQLVFVPLAGAIAAGNTVIIKPSEISSNTTQIIQKIIKEIFDEEYIACISGGVLETQALLKETFNHIFFTGSSKVGRIVMESAAKNLTPVTLELGGKSPCIVDKKINLKLTAKRIVWGKFINVGQSCIAPDYLLVHKDIKEDLLQALIEQIEALYGKDASVSKDYPRIINHINFERLKNHLEEGEVIFGGKFNEKEKYISPTLLEGNWESEIMKEEIFGPLLPILSYSETSEISQYINKLDRPLALYIFSNDRSFQKRLLREIPAGNGSINDTMMQFGNTNLPFGGVNQSGIGKYHGKYSFSTFSNHKSIYHRSNLFDPPLRYPPYKDSVLKIIRFLLR
jgi:aldehyde dehydrogenase (NAD+)